MNTSRLADQLTQNLRDQLPAALDLLERMVRINSLTSNGAGVDSVSQVLIDDLAPLGFKSERIPSTTEGYGHHVVLTRPGRTSEKIGLVIHFDTVFPAEEEDRNDFHWRREEDRIYGPGTMDMKGGIVLMTMILRAIQAISPAAFDEVTWVVLGDASEEAVSDDFGAICAERLREGHGAALVFEPAGPTRADGKGTSVVIARKGRARFDVVAHGRGAHAGGHHARGANAIVQLARIIDQLHALTDYERDLTFNVGTIEGGTVVNRVPHEARAGVEMRAFSKEAYLDGLRAALALGGPGTVTSADGSNLACEVTVELLNECRSWPHNPGTTALLKTWEEAIRENGVEWTLLGDSRAGLSDANLLWDVIPTMDGLGPLGDNAHCSEQSADGTKEQEYVVISSFVPLATVHSLGILRLIGEAK